MRILIAVTLVLGGLLCARAAELAAQAGALYSADFETRSRAVKALSGAKTPAEAAAVIERLRQELACAAAKDRARNCHDPKFVYNALLVAGNLAEKYTEAPWAFLVALSEGGTLNEGSFFQDKSESDEHRGSDYFTPRVPDGKLTRAYLQATLDKVIEKAGVVPSCDWPLERVKSLAKKTHDDKGYQVYSYSRDYSPQGILGQYRVVHARDWLYSGARRISCGGRTVIADLGPAGLYFAAISDRSDEQYCLDIALHALPSGKPACAYTVEGISELEPDPLGAVAANPVKFLPALFDFTGGACRPRPVSGYAYTPLAR
jgi:hypothetical protein